MRSPVKSFCGVNKYQLYAAVCAFFLLYVCYQSQQARPVFDVPQNQHVEPTELHASTVSVEEILALGGPWNDYARNTFVVHSDYAAVEPEVFVSGPPGPGPCGDPDDPFSPDAGPGRGATIVKPSDGGDEVDSHRVPSFLNELDPVSHPKFPSQRGVSRTTTTDTSLDLVRPESTAPVFATPATVTVVTPTEPIVVDAAYELPFKLEGIVRPDQRDSSLVILQDRETGKRVRRFQGQQFNGVIIRRIGTGTVEVEVPDERLQLRYVDSTRRWVTM